MVKQSWDQEMENCARYVPRESKSRPSPSLPHIFDQEGAVLRIGNSAHNILRVFLDPRSTDMSHYHSCTSPSPSSRHAFEPGSSLTPHLHSRMVPSESRFLPTSSRRYASEPAASDFCFMINLETDRIQSHWTPV